MDMQKISLMWNVPEQPNGNSKFFTIKSRKSQFHRFFINISCLSFIISKRVKNHWVDTSGSTAQVEPLGRTSARCKVLPSNSTTTMFIQSKNYGYHFFSPVIDCTRDIWPTSLIVLGGFGCITGTVREIDKGKETIPRNWHWVYINPIIFLFCQIMRIK